ncbi:uncharacterized protein UTRI_06183 [Ustilago trichophora]|uniref:Uncharacterized protein n=1 Tax=Ustilago trichophora TaxID=86804 RepID=A0A5C3EEZ5_9BASI|nr:uncharacterized protein UTRI_06183 [Ustilago trichophora]
MVGTNIRSSTDLFTCCSSKQSRTTLLPTPDNRADPKCDTHGVRHIVAMTRLRNDQFNFGFTPINGVSELGAVKQVHCMPAGTKFAFGKCPFSFHGPGFRTCIPSLLHESGLSTRIIVQTRSTDQADLLVNCHDVMPSTVSPTLISSYLAIAFIVRLYAKFPAENADLGSLKAIAQQT